MHRHSLPSGAAATRRARARTRLLVALVTAVVGGMLGAPLAAAAGYTPIATADSVTVGFDSGPRLATAADGTAFAAWVRSGTAPSAVVAVRAPGGHWATQELGAASPSAGGVPIVVTADGTATVLVVTGDGKELRAYSRPPGGTFGNPRLLTTNAVTRVATPALAANAFGETVAAWRDSADGGANWTPRAVLRDGGGWNQSSPVGPTGPITDEFLRQDPMSVAINDAGRAAIGFGARVDAVHRPHLSLRLPGKAFPAAATVLSTEASAVVVRTAVTPAGRVLAAFNELPAVGEVRAAFRVVADNDVFSPRVVISADKDNALVPSVAAGPGEQFHAVWQSGLSGRVSYLHVPESGLVQNKPLSPAGAKAQWPSITIDAAGNRLVGWQNTSESSIQTAFRGVGDADFAAPLTVPGASSLPAFGLGITNDHRGNFVLGWGRVQLSGATPVQLAAFDTEAPSLTNLSVAGAPTATISTPFSVIARDTWSTPTVAWAFGDGATASGEQADHAYAVAGGVTATATATDGVGNVTSASAGVNVGAHPGVDADRDGFLSTRDCNDRDARVNPTAKDVPGNGIDENCDGHDSGFRTIDGTTSYDYTPVVRKKGIRFLRFDVVGVRVGDRVKLRCDGKGCKRSVNSTTRVKKVDKKNTLSLYDRVKGLAFGKGATITVTISREDFSTKVISTKVTGTKKPRKTTTCLVPDTKRTTPCA